MTTFPLAGRAEVRRWARTVIRENRVTFCLLLTLFGLATAANLVGPRLLGYLVESVHPGTGSTQIDLIALVFLGVLVGEALLRRFAQFVAAVFGERLLAGARERLVSDAVRLPIDKVETAGTGDLLSRATSDVDKLDEGLRQAAPEILVAVVMVALTAVAMVLASPTLAAGVLIAVPVLVVATRWYRPRAVPNYEWLLARWADVHANTHETVSGGRTVEAHRLTRRRLESHDNALDQALAGENRAVSLWSRYLAFLDLSAVLTVAAILALGAWQYSRGWVGIGAVTATVLYARALAEPLNNALGWMDELHVGLAALRRVLGVGLAVQGSAASRAIDTAASRAIDTAASRAIDTAASRAIDTAASRAADTAAHGSGGPPPSGRTLRVDAVTFGYRAERPVLREVSLDVAPGERIAVVGPSGAGKSKLGRLLAGINHPDEGAVTLGGVPVGSLSEEQRRSSVLLVTQEQHVFAGTLRDNLTLPRDATDAELWRALRAVSAHEWAESLAGGLDTEVGAGGVTVPLAVAQQIALARVLVADPGVLILDEATSLLDPSSARELDRSLAAVLNGRTVVTITHQLASARVCDRIVVLDSGRIVEHGTHDELMAAAGSYRSLAAVG